MLLLLVERLGERDVAVKMPLVKFVEENCRDAAQLRVVDHLPQQNAFGHEADFCLRRRDILKADLVADFLAKFDAEFRRDTLGEQSRREPARLKHHDLSVAEQAMFQKHLRHLRGFAGAGGRG